MKRGLSNAALAAWLACKAAAGADWGFDATAGFTHDDNVPNALEADDRKADTAAAVNLSAGLHQQIGPGTGLGVSLVAESVTYLRYAGLSNLALGARAQVREKFGLGAEAPWVVLAAGALHRDYHYDYRDGWQYDINATVGKRLDERWSVRGSARYDRYEADNLQPALIPGVSTAAYDIAGRSFGAGATFLATEDDTLSLAYAWRNGNVTAVTPPEFEILEYSDAVARDTVFDPALIAYRIKAWTDNVSVNWSHALGRAAAVNLGYTYRRSKTETELGEYYSNLITLSVSYSR